ncbi:MAG: ComF family protein [Oscillospiraceae bacterium]|nr:ComF family protein [Oscillospiraceae bacterium]
MIWRRFLDVLYPPRCAFCRRLLRTGSELWVCPECLRTLPRLTRDEQRRDVKHTELTLAPLRYEGVVRESLLRYKFGGLTAYAAVYAEFLAKCIDENEISCDSITWVPLSRRRLRQRGYDQARLIAEELAKRLDLPCECLLVKRRHTRPQSGIGSPTKRRANAAGAYAPVDPQRARGKRVLLVDDIVTTGATLSSCAGVLAEAGCAAVFGAAAASRS